MTTNKINNPSLYPALYRPTVSISVKYRNIYRSDNSKTIEKIPAGRNGRPNFIIFFHQYSERELREDRFRIIGNVIRNIPPEVRRLPSKTP